MKSLRGKSFGPSGSLPTQGLMSRPLLSWDCLQHSRYGVCRNPACHRQQCLFFQSRPNAPTLRLVPSYGGGSLNNQKYNVHLKEVGKLAGMTGDWITEKQSGRTKTREVRPKYELLTSHVARRWICVSRELSGVSGIELVVEYAGCRRRVHDRTVGRVSPCELYLVEFFVGVIFLFS